MTNKGILKRKERRKLKREWKMKVLQFAKEFYNTPIQKENPCEQVQRYFKGNQNFELYLGGMVGRLKSTWISLPPSS